MQLGYIPGSHPGHWNALSHRLFGSRKFSRTIEFRIIRSWLPSEKVQVLDVAAGSGELSQQLALLGHSVTALDHDADALRQANTPWTPQIQLIPGDAHHLPFEASSFDLVVCNSALEHFADDEKALADMARVLRPKGRVIITTDTFCRKPSALLGMIPKSWRREEMKGKQTPLATAMQSYHKEQHGVVNYYSKETLEHKLRMHGLMTTDCRYYLNGPVSKAIFEAHILVKQLNFYNDLSRRLFPLFFPFTFPVRRKAQGYGLAVCAVKATGG